MGIKSITDLKVYNNSYDQAMEIFELSRGFPPDEVYSLTSQIRKSSRSVPMNIREGFAKRKYVNIFIRHLNDSLGSSEETRGWLQFAKDCGYLEETIRKKLDTAYHEISAMIFSLMNKWESFKK